MAWKQEKKQNKGGKKICRYTPYPPPKGKQKKAVDQVRNAMNEKGKIWYTGISRCVLITAADFLSAPNKHITKKTAITALQNVHALGDHS